MCPGWTRDWLAGWSNSDDGGPGTEIRLSCGENFCPIWANGDLREGFSVSCAFASSAAAGSWQIMSTGRTELNHVLGFTRVGRRLEPRTGRENNWSRRKFPLDFRAPHPGRTV